jgi:putative SOS response-associated peptidase YedK
MCYDIKTQLQAQLQKAKRLGDLKAIDEITRKLLPYTDLPLYHASGFSHPKILIYTVDSPDFPSVAQWGLVPHWVKNEEGKKKLWNNTLNARGETLTEKPAFRTAVKRNRCLIYLEGFYEHHHFQGATYPFYVSRKDGKPLVTAGLYSDWQNPDKQEWERSFTIITTKGNEMMSKIHNNPKMKEARMPVFLETEAADRWLEEYEGPQLDQILEELLQPASEDLLQAKPVRKLRGKEYIGNTLEITQAAEYPELLFDTDLEGIL